MGAGATDSTIWETEVGVTLVVTGMSPRAAAPAQWVGVEAEVRMVVRSGGRGRGEAEVVISPYKFSVVRISTVTPIYPSASPSNALYTTRV